MRQTRRRFLLGATGAAAGAMAGCLGSADGSADGGANATTENDSSTVQASFFVLADFATEVAGESADVRNLVPFGQHGHGWEPGPDVQRDVLDSDAFLYVGEGFQPWADKLVRNVRDDGADVEIVEAWEGISLLAAPGETHDDHDEATHDGHDEETHGDHDHGSKDPHFWLDPERAAQSVENVASGLATVDPENESAYAEGASSFTDRLNALDETFEERLADRSREAILVAGHNSFQYLGRRYDVRVEALSGISPDATPTPRDVVRAQSVVEEHGIEHVLAPVFESDRAAKQLVEETDAKGVLPLTPVPTLTDEWADEGWGYVEVMENVNLPSLATALGAE